ncbi:MAG TPA: hypothetical protein VFU47_14415, partial [Armatimonadota bacterium]|nr:hypothetical protein [Armatimonadota bacterium]
MSNDTTIIYQDAQRTITRHGDHLIITSVRGEKHVTLASTTGALDGGQIKAVRQAGFEPAGWFAVMINKCVLAICPPETRPAIEKAQRDYKAEIEAIRNDPANVERRRISDLVERSRRAYNRGEWAESIQLEMDAEEALKAWEVRFPEAAKREERFDLLTRASELESKAVGALVYDADGWLSREDQEQRAAEFRAQA